MLQDFEGIVTKSKREAVNDVLCDLQELKTSKSFQQMLNIAEGYVNRKVLPYENVYMAKVRFVIVRIL